VRQRQGHAPLEQVEQVQGQVVPADVLATAAVDDVDPQREVLRLEVHGDLDQRQVGGAAAEVHGQQVELVAAVRALHLAELLFDILPQGLALAEALEQRVEHVVEPGRGRLVGAHVHLVGREAEATEHAAQLTDLDGVPA